MQSKFKVFLCYAHADRDSVRSLYSRLTRNGIDVWLDSDKLLPGQDWEVEIRKAAREADVMVVCLSKHFNQNEFRQKEVRLALDTAMEKPEGEIFIIPARLEECDTPESLRKLNWVDLFEDDGYEKLLRVLRIRADKLGIQHKKVSSHPVAKAIPFPTPMPRPIFPPKPKPNTQPAQPSMIIVATAITVVVVLLTQILLSTSWGRNIISSPWISGNPTPISWTSTIHPNTLTPKKTFTPIPKTSHTPNPTQTLQSVFDEIDNQFEKTLKGNIAFNKPEKMKRNESASVELILSPSLSQSALATQVVQRGGFVTSTAEPNILIAPNGEKVTVTTRQIEITPRMKAVLLPQDPEAFTIKEMHDNAEQVVSSVDATAWRWSVTAKKEGSQTLELVIYQLVKYDGKEFWHEVETYKANIVVEVTLEDKVKALDWFSTIGAIVAVIGAVLSVWNWLEGRKKKAAESKSTVPVRRIK